MSRTVRPPRRAGPRVLSPVVRWTAGAATGLAVLGAALGVLGWSGPLEEARSVQVAAGRHVTFGYSSTVPHSAAYDGTSVAAPDPIFRKLASLVAMRVSYVGDPGSMAVAAELSTPSGWHTSVILVRPTRFSTPRYDSKAMLDLAAISARGQAAAAASGMPETDVSIAIRATIKTETGATFTPALLLRLTPLQLAMAGTPADLHVTDTTTTSRAITATRMVSVQHRQLAAGTARHVAAVLLTLALLVAALAVWLAWREPRDEAKRIRRRYGPLLARVLPVPADDAHPPIDVPEFAILAKLAERNGSLILHWPCGTAETYVVRDEGTTYRYRSDAAEVALPLYTLSSVKQTESLRSNVG